MNKVNTAIETDQKIIEGLLNAPTIGGNCYKKFFRARLVDRTTSLFAPIKYWHLVTGYKKKKAQKRNLCFKRRFTRLRNLIWENNNYERSLQVYYITTAVPFSLAFPDGTCKMLNALSENLKFGGRGRGDKARQSQKFEWDKRL